MKKYDIFISYRRSSYDTANLIATRLKSEGYSVFFDMEALRSGKFNEQLYDAIDNCKDFIVVLPPNALDRCVNEDDWVRLEVCRAIAGKKNIIPVMLNGFVWPKPMPEGMEYLEFCQALTASSVEYFDMSMERLQKRYLISKRHLPLAKISKTAGIILTTLMIVVAILWGVFMMLSRGVCTKYATKIAMDAANVHHVVAIKYKSLKKYWEEYERELSKEKDPEYIADLQTTMLDIIKYEEEDIKKNWTSDSVAMDIIPYHNFLLSLHGIESEDIAVSPLIATQYRKDFLDFNIAAMRKAVEEPTTINMRYVTAQFDAFEHQLNGYYVAVLSTLSKFPKYSRKSFEQMSKDFIYFPLHINIDEDEQYYESVIERENKIIIDIMSRYSSYLEGVDAELQEQEKRLDNLEVIMNNGLSQMQARADSTEAALQAAAEYTEYKKKQEENLAIRKEKVETKKVEINAYKAQLEELDKQYKESYNKLKEKCTIDAEDEQWYKWGKIRRWGKFLANMVESRKKLEAQEIYSTSSVTPEIAYADMNSLLTVYESYHPESKEYVAAAKLFFKGVARRKLPYAGTIVFGFKDDALHPTFKKGDIFIRYNGEQIKTHDDFKAAYKKDSTGTATYLRVINGNLEEFESKMTNSNIIGFLELTEEL